MEDWSDDESTMYVERDMYLTERLEISPFYIPRRIMNGIILRRHLTSSEEKKSQTNRERNYREKTVTRKKKIIQRKRLRKRKESE